MQKITSKKRFLQYLTIMSYNNNCKTSGCCINIAWGCQIINRSVDNIIIHIDAIIHVNINLHNINICNALNRYIL